MLDIPAKEFCNTLRKGFVGPAINRLNAARTAVRAEWKKHGYGDYPPFADAHFRSMETHINKVSRLLDTLESCGTESVSKEEMKGHLSALEPLDDDPLNVLERNHPLIGVPWLVREVEGNTATMESFDQKNRRRYRILRSRVESESQPDAVDLRSRLERSSTRKSLDIEDAIKMHRSVLNACFAKLGEYEHDPESKKYTPLIKGLHSRIRELHKKLDVIGS